MGAALSSVFSCQRNPFIIRADFNKEIGRLYQLLKIANQIEQGQMTDHDGSNSNAFNLCSKMVSVVCLIASKGKVSEIRALPRPFISLPIQRLIIVVSFFDL